MQVVLILFYRLKARFKEKRRLKARDTELQTLHFLGWSGDSVVQDLRFHVCKVGTTTVLSSWAA